MKKFIPLLALALTSCQLGPFYYELDRETYNRVKPGNREEIGAGYSASKEACFLAKTAEEMSDEEISEASDYPRYPGNGYSDSEWYAEHADELAMNVYECEDGDIVIVDDDGEIIIIKHPSKVVRKYA
jgi:hypothetical protein